MLNLTIDGKQIQVTEGTTVLNAARQASIEIPTLCDHPELTPYGGCRLCLVEVDGFRTLQPSCTLPVSNNMVVRTDTPKIRDARKFVLTMLFSERNHFCMYCQVSGGDCELQNAAYAEGMTHWPIQPNWKPYPVDASHPYIILEHNRCILCRRCVRACGELVGNFTLGFEERGADSTLVADLGVPLGESSCIGCGTCVQVCPTGALIDRWSAYQGKAAEGEKTDTICVGCSIGCGIEVHSRDNRLVGIDGKWDSVVNGGVICDVGRFHPMGEERERLLTPMVRKEGVLKAATWEEAMSVTVQKFLQAKDKQAVAGIVSNRLPIESINVFKQTFSTFAGSHNITNTEETSGTSVPQRIASKVTKNLVSSIESVKEADFILLVGEDLSKDHQVLSFFAKRSIATGTNVVLIGSKENGMKNYVTALIDTPVGNEADVIEGLAAAKNSADHKAAAAVIAAKANVKQAYIEETLAALGNSTNPVVIFGSRSAFKNGEKLADALSMFIEKIGASLVCTLGGANSLLTQWLELNGTYDCGKAEFVYIALGDEKPTQQLSSKLESPAFKVVQSAFVSPLTASADVVFPVETWLEQTGSFINLEGRVQTSHPALKPAEGIRSNLEVLSELAKRAGFTPNSDWKKQLSGIKTL